MDRSKAIIGADAKFVGTISNVKSIEIEGTVEADLSAEKLSIGATGRFTGQVTSDLVVIGGAYDGIMQVAASGRPKQPRLLAKFTIRACRWIAVQRSTAVLSTTGRSQLAPHRLKMRRQPTPTRRKKPRRDL